MCPFHTKYRPGDFDEIIGNKSLVRTLEAIFKKGKGYPHSYLLHGKSGCGKTSIARIIAKKLKCSSHDFREMDFGRERGIDVIREMSKNTFYKPLDGGVKVVLIDECHQMTRDACNALLKILEEPPSHAYFILCTTDPQKLLTTVKNRCMEFEVNSLTDKQMKILLHRVCEKEAGREVKDKILRKIIDKADGCPRHALQLLEQIISLSEKHQLKAIKAFQTQEEKVIDLCRALLVKERWSKVAKLIKGLEGEPEKIRLAVLGYMASVMLGSEKGNTQAAITINNFKDAFYNSGRAGLIFACYRSISWKS